MQFKRGKRKFIADYKTKDIYRYYREEGGKITNYKLFVNLISEFNEELIKLIVNDGYEFIMPARLGSIRIRKKKVKIEFNPDGTIDKNRLSPDWVKSKKFWAEKYKGLSDEEIAKIPDKRIIYNLNEHTDGYRFGWYWDKITSNILNQTAYRLEITRDWNNYFAQQLKTNSKLKNIYYE